MRTNSTAEILTVSHNSNCKIYENTLFGNAANPGGLFDTGINTANSSNLIFCCNSVDNTTYGTMFNSTNSDVRFFTTQYGEHDTALYFQPTAFLNAQNNTGNNWTGGTTSLDAYYTGTLGQAQANASFRTDPANINGASILPLGWFNLQGNDPSCSKTNTVTCDTLDLPTGFTEINSEDLAGLAPPGYDNEEALRFGQKRQLYRKLKENPALATWNAAVNDFYSASATNSVGAMYAVDEGWRNLYTASAGVSAAYESLSEDLEDVYEAIAGIYEDYPGATSAQQATMLADMRDLTTQILEIEADLRDLTEQEREDYDQRLDDLLALNGAMTTGETWETAEKDVNDLLFRYCTGLIQTFTSGQQSQIVALARECPQFYGAGVYKARYLREQIDTVAYHYFENHCVGAERSNKLQSVQQVSVVPNPAADRVMVNLSGVDGQSGKITLQSLDGRAVLAHEIATGSSAQTLDVSNLLPGIYWLTVSTENTSPVTTRLVIIR